MQPSVAPGTGTGNERIYSFSDIVALKVAFELRKAGVTTSSLKKVLQFLRENEGSGHSLANSRLVVSGRDVLVVRSNNELVSALSKPGQSCLSFVLDLPRTLGGLTEIGETANVFAVGVASVQRPKRPAREISSSSQHKRA